MEPEKSSIERVVGKSKGAGRLYVPKDWIGKRVRVELLEKESEKQ